MQRDLTDEQIDAVTDRRENLQLSLNAGRGRLRDFARAIEAAVRAALASAPAAEPVGTLTVQRFRGHLENASFDYSGSLADGTYPLYTRPATQDSHPQAQVVASKVYLVATGETHEGEETYTRHDKPVPLADQEVLYTAPQPAIVRDRGVNYGAILDALDALPGDVGPEVEELTKLVRAYGCQIGHCEHQQHPSASAHEVYLAATEPQPMPAGWVPLTIEWEAGYPEEVAFGPKHMMDRLAKWLQKHLTMLADEMKREAAAGTQDYMRGFNDAKAQLSADTERLDWLEQSDGEFQNMDRIASIVGVGFMVANDDIRKRQHKFKTLREAIDAARAAHAHGGGNGR